MVSLSPGEQYKAITKVNRAAITKTAQDEVFREMCGVTKNVIPYDRAALSLYEPEGDVLKLVARDGSFGDSFFSIGAVFRRNDSHQGWTFERQRPIVKRDVKREYEFPIEKYTVLEGVRSYCAVPLILRGASIGVVTLLSYRQGQYSRKDAAFLQELSNQIVLAIKSFMPSCASHVYTKLICPRCIASSGGKITTARYKNLLSDWGKKGGRGKKQQPEHSNIVSQ